MSTPFLPEAACDLARAHIEEGEFNGLYVIGCEDVVGVVPCFETPKATAAMLGLQVMAGKVPKPEWIVFLADTYHIELEEGDEYPGSLEEAFRAGDPRVKEAAIVLCICPDGPTYQTVQTYVRDEEEIEWDEVVVSRDISLGGVMASLMYAVLETPYGAMPDAADGIEQLRVPLL